MNQDSDQLSPVELLAEEFLERQQRGENPTIREYCERHPELSDEIRDVFEAVAMIEDLKAGSGDVTGESPSKARLSPKILRQVGDYRILREIGRGGMGVVYEAEQESLERRVALKVLPRSAAGDQNSLLRFQREARAAARMHHTNIVPVFEVGEDEELVFYAMQLIQGQGLDLVIDDLRNLRSEYIQRENIKRGSSAESKKIDVPNSLAASLVTGRFQHENLAGSDGDRSPDVTEQSAAVSRAKSAAKPLAYSATPQSSEPAMTETVASSGSSSVSVTLPGQSEVSTADSNRSAYFRSVAEIGLQTARALGYAHARGIIHRDIKPSNLILDTTGVVWVTDFGLAKTSDSAMTHTGDILGTIRYMSPERFRGQCDVRADIYAVGLTLYEMLVLQPAFESADRLQLIDLVTKTDPPSPRSIDSRVPRDLETIVLKSIDKDVKRRYQSADELADDLQRFIDDEPIRARRVSLPERYSRWSRRNPLLSATLAVAMLALVTTTVLSFAVASKERQRAQQQLAFSDKLAASHRVVEQERENAVLAKEQAEVVSEANRQQAYISTIQAVSQSLGNRHSSARQAERLLAKWIPDSGEKDYRDFAWRYFWSQTVGHSDQLALPATRLAFTESGDLLTFSQDHVYRWRLNGQQLEQLSATRVCDRDHSITMCEFSRHGKHFMITNSQDTRIFDLQSQTMGEPILTRPRTRLDVSPDRRLAGLLDSSTNQLHVWDFARAEFVRTIEDVDSEAADDFALSPDGQTIVFRDGRDLRIQGSDGTLQTHAINNAFGLGGLQTSPDGRFAALGDAAGKLNLIDLRSSRWTPIAATQSRISITRFSPDSTRIAVGDSSGTIAVYDVIKAEEIFRRQAHSSMVRALVFADNSETLASSSSDFTRVWNVSESTEFAQIDAPTEGDIPWNLDQGEDGALLVAGRRITGSEIDQQSVSIGDRVVGIAEGKSGSMTDTTSMSYRDAHELLKGESGTIVQLKLETTTTAAPETRVVICKRYPKTYEHIIRVVQFSKDGMWISNAGRLGSNLWRVGESSPTLELPSGYAAAISADSRLAAFDDTLARSVNIVQTNALDEPPVKWYIGALVSDLAFSRDGRFLIASVGIRDNNQEQPGAIKIWDCKQLKEAHQIKAHGQSVNAVAVSPDDRTLATAGSDKTIQLWNRDDWTPRHSIETRGTVRQLLFTPDGKSLIAAIDNQISIWDVDSGELLYLLEGHNAMVRGLSLANDGTLASAAWDGTVRLWHHQTFQLMAVLQAHPSAAYSVHFAPSGDLLASGGADGAIKLWRAAPTEEIDTSAASMRLRYKATLRNLSFRKFQETKALLQSIVDDQSDRLGNQHPHTLDSRFQLGNAFFQMGSYADAMQQWAQLITAGTRMVTHDSGVRARLNYFIEESLDDEVIKLVQGNELHQLDQLRDVSQPVSKRGVL